MRLFKPKFVKLCVLLCAVQFVTACATSGSSNIFSNEPIKDYSDMYLRGVFNWWEAREDFKLTLAESSDTYSVTIELIADGQPYDFKVADANWTMELNCGNAFGGSALELDDTIDLVCAADSLNLQFTPSETGQYTFQLDVSDNSQPELSIYKE